MGLVVVTRPEPDASDYADELKSHGFDVFIEPMLEIEPADFDAPDLDAYDGVLVTSANALRFLDPRFRGEDSHLVVYCVGKYTAQAARDAGFANAISVDGTGADLLAYVLALPDVRQKRFLHLCGDYVAFPLVTKLCEEGVPAKSLVVYKSVQVDEFSDFFVGLLQDKQADGQVEAITFFSKRTAEAFVRIVRKTESESALAGIKALSISDAVLECVRVLPWQAAHCSKTPDRVGMLELLKVYV